MFDVTRSSKRRFICYIATVMLIVGGISSLKILTSQYALGSDRDGTQETYREALEALYHALGGDDWNHNDGWLTDAPLKDWYGLRMSNGRITHLELDDNNLTGEIPSEIEMLDLSILDLRWNSISGGIEHLQKMKTVRELLLSANDFSGRIPRSLGDITSLNRLDLSDNQFTGSIPNRLTRLKNLVAFAAHSNYLTGKIPRNLCDLSHLQRVVLSDNALTGSITNTLVKCAKLYLLDLSNNRLEGRVPEELTASKRLKWLDLRGNEIDDENQIVFQVDFFGISTQPKHIGELNGLTLWSRASFMYFIEELHSAAVQTFNAISIEEGFIEVFEEKVPTRMIDWTREMKEFVNSSLLNSDARINTIMDLEREWAKAAKHIQTKTLERLDSMANPKQSSRFETRSNNTIFGNPTSR